MCDPERISGFAPSIQTLIQDCPEHTRFFQLMRRDRANKRLFHILRSQAHVTPANQLQRSEPRKTQPNARHHLSLCMYGTARPISQLSETDQEAYRFEQSP